MALDVPYEKNPFQGVRPESNQKLDLYVPRGTGPFPLVIYIHGGAWKGGERETRGADMAMRWLPEGFAIASIDYRFVFDAEFPGMFQDGIDAVAFLRAHANQYHLDAGRIGIMGESAGSHIAGLVAMAEGGKSYPNTGSPVQAAVLLCGFYDMTRESGEWKPGAMIDNPRDDFSNLFPNRTYDPVIAKKMSPVYQIHDGIPPVLLVRGDADTTAPLIQSELFESALRKAGAEVTFSRYPTYTHNLWKPDVIAEVLTFFKKNLQATPTPTHQ